MNFKDPYDRLDDLEALTSGLSMALEESASISQQHAQMFEQMSGHLVELAHALNSQHRLIMDMNRHIKRLESNASN